MNYLNNMKQSLLTLVVSAVGATPRSPILAAAPLPCCLNTGLLPSLSSQKIGLFSVSLPSPNSDWGCKTPVSHLAPVSFTLQRSPGIRLGISTAEMRPLSYLAASGKWCWPLAKVIWESSFLLDPQLPPHTGKPLPKPLCVCGVKDLSYVKHIVGPQFSYRCLARDPVSF